MFVHQATVRLYHTDAAGILFFGSQFLLLHDCLEAALAAIGHPIPADPRQMPVVPVVRHAACDYLAPVHVGDRIDIELSVAAISTASFTLSYRLRRAGAEVGTGTTVHVCIDGSTGAKTPVPEAMRRALEALGADGPHATGSPRPAGSSLAAG